MKTQKSTEIENELGQTTKRLGELITMRDGIGNNHQALQKGFVSGTTTLEELQAGQGSLATLESSITGLKAKQSELETELEAAQKAELKQDAIQQMKKLVVEAELVFTSYLALRTATDAVFAEAAQKLVDKNSDWRKKQSQFAAIARETGLTTSEIKSLLNDEKAFNLATITTYSVPPLAFGYAVSAAESILSSNLNKEVQAKEQAAFSERRFSRMDEMSKERMSETEKVLEYRQQPAA
jgi:hypothetical protein